MRTYAFVVLHYLADDMTTDCVRSLLALEDENRAVRVMVVDNGSGNGSGNRLQALWRGDDRVHVELLDEGIGFSRANNRGYELAVERWSPVCVGILNNDTLIEQEGFLDLLDEDLNQRCWYVVGPDILVPATGRHQSPLRRQIITKEQVEARLAYQEAWPTPAQRLRLLVSSLPVIGPAYESRRQARIGQGNQDWDVSREDVVLHGAALIYTDLFIETGQLPFEPVTFMYGEEDLLGKRCEINGWPTLYDPRLRVLHLDDGATNRAFAGQMEKGRFFMKHEHETMLLLREMLDDAER